jgi:hypothetical protein
MVKFRRSLVRAKAATETWKSQRIRGLVNPPANDPAQGSQKPTSGVQNSLRRPSTKRNPLTNVVNVRIIVVYALRKIES